MICTEYTHRQTHDKFVIKIQTSSAFSAGESHQNRINLDRRKVPVCSIFNAGYRDAKQNNEQNKTEWNGMRSLYIL